MKYLIAIFLLTPGMLVAQRLGQPAIDSIQKILLISKEDTNKVKLLNILSYNYSYSNNNEGIKYGRFALELANKLEWKPGISRAENCIGVNYYDKSENAQALEHLSKAIVVYEVLNDHIGIAKALNNKSNAYADMGDDPKALENVFNALKINNESGDKSTYINSLSIIGNIYFDQSNYPKSLEYYLRALKISEAINDKNCIANNLDGIGNIYAIQKEYDKAFEYYSRDLKIVEELGHKRGIADVNINIGCTYAAQNNHTKALTHFYIALKIDKELGLRKDEAIVCLNIGISYNSLKNYRKALAYERITIKIAEDLQNKNLIAQGLCSIGEIYLGLAMEPSGKNDVIDTLNLDLKEPTYEIIPKGKQALLKGAINELLHCFELAKEANAPDIMQRCFENLSKAYKLSGNYKLALEYADSYRSIKDSIFSKENKIRIANLESNREYDLKEKQMEIDHLDLANKLNERVIYLGGLIFILFIGFLIVHRQRMNRKRVEAEKEKTEIELSKTEKEKSHATYLLNERVKELSTIYHVNRILEQDNLSMEDVFREIVNCLPQGWQYPDVCAAKIVFDGNTYLTSNYLPSKYSQQDFIKTQDGRTGLVEVIYLEEMKDEEEGPFLKEERDLINAITRIIEVYFNKKANQDALTKSETQFRGAFEHAAIGMALVSINGTWLKVNKELCAMIGYTEKELLSLTFQQITHPEDLETDLNYLQQTLNGEIDYYRMEKRYIHKSGNIVWIRLNVSIIRDENDHPLHFVSQIEDVTARKESDMKFRNLVEKSLVGVYIIQNGKFAYVNPYIIKESGYTEEELTGMPLEYFVFKEDLEVMYRNMLARLTGQLDSVRYELRARMKNGQMLWLEMFGTSTVYQGSTAIIGTLIDITEQKAVYNELKKSEANLKSIFDTTHVSYLLLDNQFKVLALNQYLYTWYESITGFAIEVGADFLEISVPDKRENIRNVLQSVMDTTNPIEYESMYTNGVITKYITVVVTAVVSNGKSIGTCMAALDITNRKNIEIERQKMINDLVQRNRDLEQFSYIVSHNLRAPVANIIGLSNVLELDLGEEDKKEMLGNLSISVARLDNVIMDLNYILQIRQDIDEQRGIIKFSALLEEVTDSLNSVVSINKVLIKSDFSAIDEFFTIKSYLYSIFYNLVSNSIKYRQPDIQALVEISSKKQGDEFLLTFSDNGMGIDLNKRRDQVFGLYKRFHTSIEGKGMGLYMVKTQVELLGGTITVESKVNEGTIFTIKFNVSDVML